MDDHYQTLGVAKSSSLEEIKSAYRKLASKHHPDKGGDTATFQKIQAAYEILSDPEKRREFDNPMPQGTPFHFHNFNDGSIPPQFADLFRQFNVHFGNHPQPQRNKTLNLNTSVTLEEAFAGKDLVANIKLPSGKDRIINVKIPPGVSTGINLRLRELGDDTYSDQPNGDIHLAVTVLPHNLFERIGDDLIRVIDIDAIDAILGTDIEINTIDNKKLNVTIKPGTQPGTILGAQGYGMPNMHDPRFKGRLLMKVNVLIPTNLTDSQKELLKKVKL